MSKDLSAKYSNIIIVKDLKVFRKKKKKKK